MSVPNPKGRRFFWTCVKDHIINEKEDCKTIELRGFDYKLFEGIFDTYIVFGVSSKSERGGNCLDLFGGTYHR